MDRIAEITRLLDECTPIERAEVQRLMRGRFVESTTGMLSRADFERVIAETKTLNEAAKELHICRRSLQYHMRLFGMPGGRTKVAESDPATK